MNTQSAIKKILVLLGLIIVAIVLWGIMPKDPVITPVETIPESSPESMGSNYTNKEYGISLQYGSVFETNTANETYVSWGQAAPVVAKPLFSIRIPKSFQPQTNFSEATVTLYRIENSTDVCLTAEGGETASGTQNGWAVFTAGDAGAGNYYESTNYRMVKNNSCIMLQSLIHSTSLGAYDPSQGITEFDKEAVKTKLAEVIATVEI
ncbi:hypothetical protein K2Q02_00070 [Patescibacteria group bacterium]|nr:hypothetical protein [Patescibacteria group bacterium]